MKPLFKKITLYLIIIGSVTIQYSNASWYDPFSFISNTTKKVGNAAAVLWSKRDTVTDTLAALGANASAASVDCIESAEQFEVIISKNSGGLKAPALL